jgi:hypothetical protein
MNKFFRRCGVFKYGNADKVKRKKSHLPCAGIILFRFYGYYLSLSERNQHPGNLEITG